MLRPRDYTSKYVRERSHQIPPTCTPQIEPDSMSVWATTHKRPYMILHTVIMCTLLRMHLRNMYARYTCMTLVRNLKHLDDPQIYSDIENESHNMAHQCLQKYAHLAYNSVKTSIGEGVIQMRSPSDIPYVSRDYETVYNILAKVSEILRSVLLQGGGRNRIRKNK